MKINTDVVKHGFQDDKSFREFYRDDSIFEEAYSIN